VIIQVEGFASGVGGVTADAFDLASAFFWDGGGVVRREKNAELALCTNTFRAGCSKTFKMTGFFGMLFTP